MIEIALSLAVIAFALVAIIGVLPTGMNVQKENREETIINQDANLFINAIRNGARGLDDLTNYVFAITNYVQQYDAATNPVGAIVTYGYTFYTSTQNGAQTSPLFPITNGFRIIGLLGTPKFTPNSSPPGYSNHVVAFARALSGSAVEKYPQNDPNVQATAFSYRFNSETIPVTLGTNIPATTTDLWTDQRYWRNLQANLNELRLFFRWPLLPNGSYGNGWQSFHTTVSGQLVITNDNGLSLANTAPSQLLYFFQPQSFVQAPPPLP